MSEEDEKRREYVWEVTVAPCGCVVTKMNNSVWHVRGPGPDCPRGHKDGEVLA